MKILAVCQNYYPENNVFTNICEELVKQGNDVSVLTGKPNYGFGEILPEYKKIKYEEINGVKVHRVNLVARKKSRLSIIRNYLSFWANSKKWVKKCKEKYDIVYSMSMSPVTILSAGNLYKKKHHVKHIVHCVDLWPESVLVTHAVKQKSLMYKILYKWSRDLYEKADYVILGSPSYKEYFDKVLLLDKKTSVVSLPSIVEKCEGKPFKYSGKFNILYCGNLGIIQLINLIPESMKLVKNQDVIFHVIGMGPKSEELKKKIVEYNLQDRVIYHGPIAAKEASSYFVSADALYVSLENNGYVGKTIPNKLVTYLAFGKPILGVVEGDGKKVLQDAGGAFTSDADPKSIASSIDTLSALSSDQRKKLGQMNQTYYFNNLSIKRAGELINDILLKELL